MGKKIANSNIDDIICSELWGTYHDRETKAASVRRSASARFNLGASTYKPTRNTISTLFSTADAKLSYTASSSSSLSTNSDDKSEKSLEKSEKSSEKSEKGPIADFETRLTNFMDRFDSEDNSSVTIDEITLHLSGNESNFESGKVPSEFVIPLTKFADKYCGGSFAKMFAEGKSVRQKRILIKELGRILYSMEVHEVESEDTFLIWRDACRDIISWGIDVQFMMQHLKQAARNYFGYMIKGAISSELVGCILESSWTLESRAVQGLY